ncbi:MAG: hypothetical protein J7513_06585 [Solirubrobacteraceae bacterium]|nr:hypothetical protein [Solirubrobacteraceae bacterium]
MPVPPFTLAPYTRWSQVRAMVGPGGNALPLIIGCSIPLLGGTALFTQPSAATTQQKLIALAVCVAIPVWLIWGLGSDRIWWDGQRAMVGSNARGWRTFAFAGSGFVVRATVVDPIGGGRRHIWFGDDGWPYETIPEARWNPADLERLQTVARVPVVELGEISSYELHQRYPLMRRADQLPWQRRFSR